MVLYIGIDEQFISKSINTHYILLTDIFLLLLLHSARKSFYYCYYIFMHATPRPEGNKLNCYDDAS